MPNNHACAMPDVWGPGQLLAFSGLDGQTPHDDPFVLHTASQPLHFEVKMPVAAEIAFTGIDARRFRYILGDAIAADCASGRFTAAFSDHRTLIGELPETAGMTLAGVNVGRTPARCANGDDGPALYAVRHGRRWALRTVTADGSGNPGAWADALTTDLDAVLDSRIAFVGSAATPTGLDRGAERLLRKMISVMKVNACAASGAIGRTWSTPDRWPHRHMWLWDSAFHAVGMVHVDPDAAKDFILAMLEKTETDGRLVHMVQADGGRSDVTQPPVLGWATLYVLEHTGDTAWAADCLPHLRAYLDWDRTHRDRNSNHVPEWRLLDDALCRCGESGADNSSVYDRAVSLDAPDFAAFLCNDYQCLAEIADRLAQRSTADECRTLARVIGDAVNNVLWCASESFYLHRDFEGRFVRAKTVAGFMPLLAGIAPPARAEALRRHLANSATFGAPFPAPSEALDSGTFCKDMWRGPTWINMNFLLYKGLQRYGFGEEAAMVRERSLAEIRTWYERTGAIWEYYDALGVTPPGDLDRKQRLMSGNGIAPISDYHFTAALATAFMFENG